MVKTDTGGRRKGTGTRRVVDKDYRINIKLHTPEEVQLYRDAKAKAAAAGGKLRAFVLDAIRYRLASTNN